MTMSVFITPMGVAGAAPPVVENIVAAPGGAALATLLNGIVNIVTQIPAAGDAVKLQPIAGPVSYTHLTLPTNREV